jgi:hypothetical protein
MPIMTPGTSSLPKLADDEPYTMQITDATVEDGHAFDDPEKIVPTLKVTLQLPPGDTDEHILAWLPIAFGKNRKTGKPSRFRAFLNAVSGKPEDAEILWFDTERLSWGYTREDPDPTARQLKIGDKVIIRGTNGTNDQGYARFTIEKFRPASRASDVPF